jgi:hypothetical protein
MDTKQFDHPLKFFNEIANEIKHENISHTLMHFFSEHKQYLKTLLKQPEIKKAVKEKKFVAFNPKTFNEWITPYLKERTQQLKPQLQNYTSSLESDEQVKTYINQQFTFINNYHEENKDAYYKEHLKGSKGNPQKASLIIALNTILNNLTNDYKKYLVIPPIHKNNTKEFNTIDYALFHYYKKEAKDVSEFTRTENETKREAMNKQGVEYGIGGNAFANCYYSIGLRHQKVRISRENIPHIKKVIAMLDEFPNAKKIAEKELREAELLPLT